MMYKDKEPMTYLNSYTCDERYNEDKDYEKFKENVREILEEYENDN